MRKFLALGTVLLFCACAKGLALSEHEIARMVGKPFRSSVHLMWGGCVYEGNLSRDAGGVVMLTVTSEDLHHPVTMHSAVGSTSLEQGRLSIVLAKDAMPGGNAASAIADALSELAKAECHTKGGHQMVSNGKSKLLLCQNGSFSSLEMQRGKVDFLAFEFLRFPAAV
ncbi:MAG: hypothetical protein RR135_04545 [Oscillospiraceae bacterium]